MYNQEFFSSKLGKAALLSILAMVALNVVALNSQLSMTEPMMASICGENLGLA